MTKERICSCSSACDHRRSKEKIDKIEMRITTDECGYIAFAYDISYKGKLIDTLIFSDCSNRKASERMAIVTRERFES